MEMEMSHEAKLAWDIIETTGSNLFLTGKAGTGKTTFLRHLKRNTSKRCVVLAPTGIAAINAEGMTMHSFFQLPFSPHVPDTPFQQSGNHKFSKQKVKILRSLDLIVIDEISMVRADLLDAVDSVLRHYRHSSLPFGGVQLLLIGDLGQLAPVAKEEEWAMLSAYYDTPYFFSSRALRQTEYLVIELTHIYRQDDKAFVDILNKVRDNKADRHVLDVLNSRYIPDFKPADDEGYIRLTTHNFMAQQVNSRELAKLPGTSFSYKAEVEGKFPEMSYPTDEVLELKKDAQVMFVKNDSSPDKRYYNGMIGRVTAISSRGFSVVPKDGGDAIEVTPEEWTNSRYELDEKSKEIKEVVEGVFRQYPVKTAWAITVHKSQGLTFSHAIINVSSSFAHGQTYVALSRCKSLEGLVLSAPIPASAIIRDASIDAFSAFAASRHPDDSAVEGLQRRFFLEQVADLYGFGDVLTAFYSMMRVVTEHYQRTFPKLALEYKARYAILLKEVRDVAATFHHQYTAMIASAADYQHDAQLQTRLQKGAEYFLKKLREVEQLLSATQLQTDNKEVQKRTAESLGTLAEALRTKCRLLRFVQASGFALSAYLRAKALAAIEAPEKPKPQRRAARQTAASDEVVVPTGGVSVGDINDMAAFNALRAWRKERSDTDGVPAYVIMHTKVMIAIANSKPRDMRHLMLVPGFGPKKAEKYGREILAVLSEFS